MILQSSEIILLLRIGVGLRLAAGVSCNSVICSSHRKPGASPVWLVRTDDVRPWRACVEPVHIPRVSSTWRLDVTPIARTLHLVAGHKTDHGRRAHRFHNGIFLVALGKRPVHPYAGERPSIDHGARPPSGIVSIPSRGPACSSLPVLLGLGSI